MPSSAMEDNGMDVDYEEEDFFKQKNGDLQDSFRKFRDQKLREQKIQKEKGMLNAHNKPIRSQQDRDILRQLWIQQLKKYLGVPYAKRYCQPGSAEHQRGFFLDCCALLRQVTADLERDGTDVIDVGNGCTQQVNYKGFHWKLGKYNQAYQFALCGQRIAQHQLRPGDLIFYEAEYHDAWRKPQHWNITHVEVYLGPGEQSIGSRWSQRVNIHDSFRLGTPQQPSGLFNSRNYHFFSLEPWLEGVMPEFAIDDAYNKFPVLKISKTTSKSIFNDDQGEEDETMMG